MNQFQIYKKFMNTQNDVEKFSLLNSLSKEQLFGLINMLRVQIEDKSIDFSKYINDNKQIEIGKIYIFKTIDPEMTKCNNMEVKIMGIDPYKDEDENLFLGHFDEIDNDYSVFDYELFES